jgi:hypothetical protein
MRPVVASNVGENREYLTRHEIGRLARPGSAADHTNRIVELLHGGPSLQRRDNRCPIPVWEDIADDVEHFYYDLARPAVS